VSELVLVDERTGTVVTHRDVGIGVSQVLPVLVSAHANRGQLIAIEQPEIHLHPALQAELGDVLVESALGERRNTFLLETHSEHLILRVLRRIRETTDGELAAGLQPLRPADVQVVYCRPTREGAVLHELPITEDGEFARPWPDGFFAERSRELF
jgi:predicted ATPase